jgi:hypothetical protein
MGMTITDRLLEAGFSRPDTTVHNRLILGVQARDKRGKTTFAYSAPRPLVHVNTDLGLEGVPGLDMDEVVQLEVDITDTKGLSRQERIERYKPVWDGLLTKVYNAYEMLAGFGGGTVAFDTATEMDQLCRLAHFGYVGQLGDNDRRNYDVVNADWRELVNKAYRAENVNTIYICHMRTVFNGPPGAWERSGVSKLENWVQTLIQLDRDDSYSPPEFSASLLNCRQNIELIGKRLVNTPRIPGDKPLGVNFPSLLALVNCGRVMYKHVYIPEPGKKNRHPRLGVGNDKDCI